MRLAFPLWSQTPCVLRRSLSLVLSLSSPLRRPPRLRPLRPLQSRRKFSVERYSAVVTIRDGRVIRVQDFPHLQAAFEAAGIDAEGA